MEPKKCKEPGCNGIVPPDGESYWRYCNACGMKKRGNRDKNYTICSRKGCNKPVSEPHYRFCQECFYNDAKLKYKSNEVDELNPPPPSDDDCPF